MDIMFFVYTFIIVFLVNLIPIFGPPTWMVLAFITLAYGQPPLVPFVLTAVCASTLGRGLLTLSSEKIIRNRLLGDGYRKNINHLKTHLEKRNLTVSSIFLAEAFTPLPSDQFFIAYGLTSLKLRYALIPFFIGRIFTYTIWVYFATEASKIIAASSLSTLSYFSWPFLGMEAFIIFLLYLFIKIDWEYFILHKKLKFFVVKEH